MSQLVSYLSLSLFHHLCLIGNEAEKEINQHEQPHQDHQDHHHQYQYHHHDEESKTRIHEGKKPRISDAMMQQRHIVAAADQDLTIAEAKERDEISSDDEVIIQKWLRKVPPKMKKTGEIMGSVKQIIDQSDLSIDRNHVGDHPLIDPEALGVLDYLHTLDITKYKALHVAMDKKKRKEIGMIAKQRDDDEVPDDQESRCPYRTHVDVTLLSCLPEIQRTLKEKHEIFGLIPVKREKIAQEGGVHFNNDGMVRRSQGFGRMKTLPFFYGNQKLL